MENASDIDTRLGTRIKALRSAQGLSLDALAGRAGVSRSMISLVERGEASPTAAVLDRLAAGLGTTLAALFAEEARADGEPVSRRSEQAAWRDPQTGYLRRNLSPRGFPSPIELVEVELPAGTRVAYDAAFRSAPVHQQVVVLAGTLVLGIGEETHRLEAGDCIAMRLDRPTMFHNPGAEPSRHLVALVVERGI
ncbi:helix-turn-helix domain-containing protein [Salinarimonas sp.]|uniref:helix-turn-helix domain-containing protein n=1 Tax=Salinarimonas sp. TaxID=2766526 RepID=UPI003918E03A